MPLTKEQIQEVLGSSRTRQTILTTEMKEAILALVEEGMTLDEIVTDIKDGFADEGGDKVKKEHVRNYLKRQLKKSN